MAKDFSEDLLIQKFNKADADPIFPDHDLIVMSDEAHSTQNGVFADNLMHMLPTANRIGFTGTPLLRMTILQHVHSDSMYRCMTSSVL